MIIDFRADPKAARRYNVLCARTGERLDDWRISYADDVEGVVRMYARDGDGRLIIKDGDGVLEQVRKAIKIVLKSPEELTAIDTRDRIDAMIADPRRVEPDAVIVSVPSAGRVRYKLLRVTPEMFVALFHAGVHAYQIGDDALPDDARIVDVATGLPGWIMFKVESASFPPVPEGSPIPEFGRICLRRVETAAEAKASRN